MRLFRKATGSIAFIVMYAITLFADLACWLMSELVHSLWTAGRITRIVDSIGDKIFSSCTVGLIAALCWMNPADKNDALPGST